MSYIIAQLVLWFGVSQQLRPRLVLAPRFGERVEEALGKSRRIPVWSDRAPGQSDL